MEERGRYCEKGRGGGAAMLRCLVILLLLNGLCASCKRQSPDKIAAPAKTPPATAAKQTGPFSVEQIEPKVFDIVAEQMGVRKSELKRSLRLKEDLRTDELDRVELTMELEDTFHLSIPDQIADRWKTIGDLTDYIRSNYKP